MVTDSEAVAALLAGVDVYVRDPFKVRMSMMSPVCSKWDLVGYASLQLLYSRHMFAIRSRNAR